MYIDPMVKQQVDYKIQSLVSENKIFTAYNITLLLRRHYFVDHGMIKEIVNDNFINGQFGLGYVRTSVLLPGVSQSAWVYHPYGEDIRHYTGGILQATITTSHAATIASTTSNILIPSGTSHPTGYKHVDSKGRLRIPSGILAQAGINPGDTVTLWMSYIGVIPGVPCIRLGSSSYLVGEKRKVDRYGNIRFSLKKVNMFPDKEEFIITQDNRSVTITPL